MGAASLWAASELRRGWKSLLVVALLIAITGGAVMAGVAGARRAGSSVDRYLVDTGLSNVSIFTQSPLETSLRDELASDPRIGRVARMRVSLATPSSLRPGLDGSTIALPPEYWGDLVRPRLVSGRYPTGDDEIAMTEQVASLGFDIGQTVDMLLLTPAELTQCIGTGDCTPDHAGRATITGVLRFPGDLAPGPFSQGQFIAPAAFLDARGDDTTTTSGFITDLFLVDGANADELVAEYSTKVTDGGIASSDADVVGAHDAADLQHDGLLIGSAIAALTGLLIAGQAFGRFLSRRTNDAPTLDALGVTRAQRSLAAWLPGLAGAIGGTVLAVPVAIALSPMFPLGMARRADPDIGLHSDLTVMIVGSLLLFVISGSAALVSAISWSRTRASTDSVVAISPVTRLAAHLGLAPVPTMGSRFALERGSGSRRTPVLPTLAGATAAIAVVVGALVFSSSLDGLLASPDRYGAAWDLQVSAGDRSDHASGQITADDRVDAAASAESGELDISTVGGRSSQEFSVGFDPVKGSIEPVILEGRSIEGPDEILLGTTTFDRLGMHLGDRVTVGGPAGDATVTVVGRAIVPIVGSSSTDTGSILPLAVFRELGGDRNVAGIDSESVILIRVAKPADLASLTQHLERLGFGVDGVFRQSNVTILSQVDDIPLYIAAFTALLGALGVFHALVVTGRRRRRELAVMRSLGSRPSQASGVIRWQGFVLAGTALLVGVPAGIIGGRLLWRSIADNADVRFVIDAPLVAFALVVVAALIGASFFLAAGPAWAASHRRPADDLRAE